MKLKMYEYMILLHSKKDDADTVIVKDITKILAIDAKHVSIVASREIPEEYLNRTDDVEILVRQFFDQYNLR